MVKGLDIPKEKITDFCKHWKITEFALFGSVLREDFSPESDLDVLVTFAPDARWSLLDHVEMQDELKIIFGRNVDLISKRGIERSRNYIRRKEIIESAEVIYAAA
ncbi:MAG TPA: nucleotidyltransferase [Nitrospirae bacterium]|nr:nucleotidyltransferase domain protein [bacterium BMS3Abin06]HDH12517.1 nucleotidyltransferase [Nitrospirota bacterium]HDZ00676.1 nucleotidyltransferase [Nitrospirota bacterium]